MPDDLIPFRPRRTLSRYADDKAVKDFARALTDAKEKRLLELMAIRKPDEATLAEIAQLMGQTDEPAK
jgi:hypothetical protein